MKAKKGMLRTFVLFFGALWAVSPVGLAEDIPADPDDHQGAPVSGTRTGNTGNQGLIAERATPKGLEYKRLTPIEEVEWNTPNAGYRWLLSQIEAGVADTRIMRQHWWLKSRLAPFDREIPDGWRWQALERQLAPRPSGQEESTAASTFSSEGRWIPVGPTTIPGRVTGLAYVAGPGDGMLASMADGGLWLSRDAGQSWEALTELEATQASGSTAADPDDPDTLYWATGEGNNSGDNYGGIGVMSSHDGGRSWSVSNKFSGNIRCLEVDPADSQRLWACGNSGIYRSDDGGVSFSQVSGGLPTNASGTDITFRPAEPGTIFVNIWGQGLWKSSDSGENWAQVTGGLPTDLSRNVTAICQADSQVMVVSAGVNSGDLWRSDDGGQNWSQLPDPGACSSICWYANTVAIAADDCETIYAGGVRFYSSRDGGLNWSQTGGIHFDHHAILTRPGGEVIVGDDGGVYRSSDYGASFTNLSLGLPTTQYYGACGSDVAAGELMGGTQDRGSHQLREGSGWRSVLGADGGMCAIGGQSLLGEYQNMNLRRSTNGGNSFQDANSGIDSGDPKSWVGIIEKDPADAMTLYVGTNRVYRTTDFHDTAWVSVSGPLYLNRQVTALAVSPVDRNVLWAGFQVGGLYRTTGALAATPQWDNVKGSLPNRNIARVVPDRSDAGTAWVVLSGFGNPKIQFTNNAGQNYSNLTGDLPDVPVNDLVVDPTDSSVLYAATDLGIFRTVDGGVTWHGFSDGLPLAAVTDIFRHPADGSLIASTHGRSMFRWRDAAATATAVPDGAGISGQPFELARTEAGELWLRFDTESCTAAHYNLFHGDLTNVAGGTYDGATCDLSRGGVDVVPLPGAAEQSLFFLLASATADGIEGPHGYDSTQLPRPHTGVGLCGVTSHDSAATCP